MKLENAAVIGAGPAGVAAAIQLQRYGLKPLVFECGRVGGLVRNANLVENLPGFPGGVPGMALASLIERQANDMALEIIHEEVTRLECEAGRFLIETDDNSYACRSVVVASGTKPALLDNGILTEETAPHVFCEIEPLLSEHGRDIAIAGGGDCAFDYALNLSRHNRVTILMRSNKPSCLPLLVDRVRAAGNIKVYPKTWLVSLTLGDSHRLHLNLSRAGHAENLETHFLVLAIGRRPFLDFWKGSLDDLVEISRHNPLLQLVGDVKNGSMRQVSIAMGDGVRAAMEIQQHLKDHN